MSHPAIEALKAKHREYHLASVRGRRPRKIRRTPSPDAGGCIAALFILTGFATIAFAWVISALLSLAVPAAIVGAAAAVIYFFLTGEFPLAQ